VTGTLPQGGRPTAAARAAGAVHTWAGGRPRTYGPEVVAAAEVLWEASGQIGRPSPSGSSAQSPRRGR
jgi:hypothetical protein